MNLDKVPASGDDAGLRAVKKSIRDLETRLDGAMAALGGLQGLIDSQAKLAATSTVAELEVSFTAGFTGFHADFVKIDKPAWASRALLIGGIQVASNGLSLADGGMRVVDVSARSTDATTYPGDLELVAEAEVYTGYAVPRQRMFSLPTGESIWIRPYIVTDGSPGSGTCRIKISVFVYWSA